ncbi:MAG TPA: GH116 family glycosyl-hydrolase [Acidobacteriaceae bacterium]|nr:GH116 family glycosyl-hydrolase [Acidobacteriaceae bacterium]
MQNLTREIRRFSTALAGTLMAVGILSLSNPLLAQTAKSLLEQLQFKNSGTVTREMDFRYFHQPDDYLETPELWSIFSSATYLYRVDGGEKRNPPEGMRSAVPLGGLGSGTVELRADGSLRDWNIFNNSPAYGEKVQLDDALFGIRISQQNGKSYTSTLRTKPPCGLQAIEQIQYSGDFPVSRLRFSDPDLKVPVDLYAYSEFKPRDADASATPAAIFTFLLSNPSRHDIHASLLFLLPNHMDGSAAVNGGLTFIRDGKLPLSGTIAVRAVGSDIQEEAATASDFRSLWKSFAAGKSIIGAGLKGEAPRYGALNASVTIKPGETKALTFILAWYLPNRPFLNATPGNYYTTLYRNADDVAEKVAGRLQDDWLAMLQWQRIIYANSLPAWLQDSLINSVATMYKTGMRFRDGDWRQWESFACADIDPGHIDFYQVLPYMFFYPELRKQILSRFATVQYANGYIPEELNQGGVAWVGPFDQAGGRDMGDSTTVFILGVWQYYLWTGDRSFLDAMWPHVRSAALWQIERSKTYGLPEYLQTTYDLFHFNKKTLVSYNAFLYLASMRAAEKLAQIQKDPGSASKFQTAFALGQSSLDQHLWTGKYFRAWWSDDKTVPNALLADTLYGQLWASVLNLGLVTDKDRLLSHLSSEEKLNESPFGLRVMSGANPQDSLVENTPWEANQPKPNDNLIWPAGSLDWSSLKIYLGGKLNESLTEASNVISNQRLRINDQWNYTDLNNNWDGGVWANSHYTRQLILWTLPLALSGQQWDAPARRLTFNPVNSAPRQLPFFTPQATGVVESIAPGKWRIRVTSGQLALHEVQISNARWTGDRTLNTGNSLDISSAVVTAPIPTP